MKGHIWDIILGKAVATERIDAPYIYTGGMAAFVSGGRYDDRVASYRATEIN